MFVALVVRMSSTKKSSAVRPVSRSGTSSGERHGVPHWTRMHADGRLAAYVLQLWDVAEQHLVGLWDGRHKAATLGLGLTGRDHAPAAYIGLLGSAALAPEPDSKNLSIPTNSRLWQQRIMGRTLWIVPERVRISRYRSNRAGGHDRCDRQHGGGCSMAGWPSQLAPERCVDRDGGTPARTPAVVNMKGNSRPGIHAQAAVTVSAAHPVIVTVQRCPPSSRSACAGSICGASRYRVRRHL